MIWAIESVSDQRKIGKIIDLPRPILPSPTYSAMQTPFISILFFLIAALAGAVGQFLYKTGADAADGGALSYLLNVRLWGGVLCYISVMILFIAAFKKGGALTVLYPIYASTFIWAALIGLFAYGIPIKPANIAGMTFIMLGMYLMGR